MQQIETDFKKVKASLDKIKALRAWQRLKESENSRLSAELIIPDSTEQDIYNEMLFVDYYFEQVENRLTDLTNIDRSSLQNYKSRLIDFKKQFSRLRLSNTHYPENYCFF